MRFCQIAHENSPPSVIRQLSPHQFPHLREDRFGFGFTAGRGTTGHLGASASLATGDG
jgi:hypothetical protein